MMLLLLQIATARIGISSVRRRVVVVRTLSVVLLRIAVCVRSAVVVVYRNGESAAGQRRCR